MIPQSELKMYPYSYHTLKIQYFGEEVFNFPTTERKKFNGFYTTFSNSIIESNNVNLTITAQVYVLSASLIYLRIRVTFVVILAITFLSALLLISLYLDGSKGSAKDKKSKKPVKEEISDDDELILDDETDVLSEEADNETLQDEYEEDSFAESENEEAVYENNESINNSSSEPAAKEPEKTEVKEFEKPDVSYGEITNQITTPLGTAPAPVEKKVSTEEVLKSTPEDHDQMFSTATGFCFEKHLVSRLESELARAASSQIDISLVLVKIPGLILDSQCGIDICKKILDIFHYRDMLFEYKTDGIAIIFSNANIDKAMESCESIYAEICSVLSRNNSNSKPYIGIASRSLRFISGERIITEAEQALVHASEDQDSPIIAFRVNPEKYRKYMATKQ